MATRLVSGNRMVEITMQDLLEAAICEFVKKYRKAA